MFAMKRVLLCCQPDCKNIRVKSGLCKKHLNRKLLGLGPDDNLPSRKVDGACSVDGCLRELYAKGFCNHHYQRNRLGKEMTPGLPPKSCCFRCQKPLAEGEKKTCKDCKKQKRKNARLRWEKKNPNNARKRNTGFDLDLLKTLRVLQSGLCSICEVEMELTGKSAKRECADHFETLDGVEVAHGTPSASKHPRGLLCSFCNLALGMYCSQQRKRGFSISQYENYLDNYPVKMFSLR